MKTTQKILSAFLTASLLLLPALPLESAYASNAEEVSVHQQPFGPLVPVVSVTDAIPQSEAPAPVCESINQTTDEFLVASDENPLSPADADEEIVTIDSNDPFYNSSGSWGQSYEDLWWLKDVHADDAWGITRGAGATVAVIDTGVDFNHPDLASNIWSNTTELNGLAGVDDDGNGYIDDIHGWDFHNGDNNPWDDNGHGSHVSGIIGAAADNFIGIAGIAPESKIIPVKILNASGSGYVSNLISGIRYAANLGAQVINMSLGLMKFYLSYSLRVSLENAVKYAIGKGSVVVAAAGNDNSNVSNFYPAAIRDVIAVGAVEPVTHNRAWFSNYGSSFPGSSNGLTALDFVAPGVDVLSLRAGGTSFGSNSTDSNYSRASGTSMASPVVAGTVALLKAQYPTFTLNDIYNRLKNSATDLGTRGFDRYYGYGLVNAYKALTFGSSLGSSLGASSVTIMDSDPGISLFGLARNIFEGVIDSPRFVPTPVTVGNWYAIKGLSSTSHPRAAKRKKKSPLQS